jgi:cell division protease FtsH
MTTSDSAERDFPKKDAPPDGDEKGWLNWRTVGFFLALLALNYILASAFVTGASRVEIPYNPTFLQQVSNGNVASIGAKASAVQGTFKREVRYPASDKKANPTTRFKTEVPAFANTDSLDQLLRDKGVVVKAQSIGTPWWQTLLYSLGPALLFIGLWIWLIRRSGSGAGGMFSMGKAKPRQYEPTKEHVSFDDVAGIDEAEDELAEVVDFLRNPGKYRKLGARIPRGVLLTGAPGTGKTLLARAVAGEAGVPFFSMSASEFVEMIVGVGASRVRDLFAQAKSAAPSIIFVDEIDAIGRSRGTSVAGSSGANDEREQTLNQILTEMDGFDASTGVVVLAATNRADVLDPALLRPGRFDRRVTVQAPDKDGRKQILRVHTRSIPLADDVDFDALAAATVGMVGADLANVANEGALLAARRGHERVDMKDLSDALEKIVLGAERKVVLSEADRRRTAYHEAGHAIAGMLTPGADPVRRISIIPRGASLGVTYSMPESDRSNYDKQYVRARIRVAVGGRAAEEVVFGNETTGAESDIRQATQLARNMVGRWGMSDTIGFVSVLPQDGESWWSADQPSEHTRRLMDDEIRQIIDDAHADVTQLLADNRARLDGLAEALMREETLDEADAYAAAGVAVPLETTPEVPRRDGGELAAQARGGDDGRSADA